MGSNLYSYRNINLKADTSRNEKSCLRSKNVWPYLLVILIFCNAQRVLRTLERQHNVRDLVLKIKKMLQVEHTSMIAAWTLGFWKAWATSGLAIIFAIVSSGESPIWSAKCKKEAELKKEVKTEYLTSTQRGFTLITQCNGTVSKEKCKTEKSKHYEILRSIQ